MFLMFYFLRPAPTIGVGKNRFIMKSEISPARFFIIKSLISFRLSIKSDTSPRLIIKSEISFRFSIKSSSSSPKNIIMPSKRGPAGLSSDLVERTTPRTIRNDGRSRYVPQRKDCQTTSFVWSYFDLESLLPRLYNYMTFDVYN